MSIAKVLWNNTDLYKHIRDGLSIANLHDLIDMGLIKNEIDLIKLPDNLNADNHIKNLLINRSGWGKLQLIILLKLLQRQDKVYQQIDFCMHYRFLCADRM